MTSKTMKKLLKSMFQTTLKKRSLEEEPDSSAAASSKKKELDKFSGTTSSTSVPEGDKSGTPTSN